MQPEELQDNKIEKSETICRIEKLHTLPIPRSEIRILDARVILSESLFDNLGDSDSSDGDTPSEEQPKENSSQEKSSSEEEEESSEEDSSANDESSNYNQPQVNLDFLRGYQFQQIDRTVEEGIWDYVYEHEGDEEFYF